MQLDTADRVFFVIVYFIVAFGFWIRSMDFDGDELAEAMCKGIFAMVWPVFIPLKFGAWLAGEWK